MLPSAVEQVLALYPRIYFACHTRHIHDPEARRTLSAAQASILDHLDDVAPTNLNTLAAHMGVTASTMSISVARLIRQGYILRAVDSIDRRKVRLRLSAAGVRIKQAKSVLDPARVDAMLDVLTQAERAEAIHGLALLARAASASMRRQSKLHSRVLPPAPSRSSSPRTRSNP